MDARDEFCPFCDIVDDPRKARVLYADAHTLAFFPLTPATQGHTLVVPKAHSTDLWAMDETAAQRLFRTVLLVGRALRTALEPDGMNVINSAGTAASQTVFHTHVHLVPRRPGDAMGLNWPAEGEGYQGERDEDGAESDALAARLREAIDRQRR
ncbi:HIT family protein [Streptomyces sp. CA-288835]|uniref:HIT family protein n=1 Tax=Streptomyces sp. CA-288835 TaxID=3240069 RepID=UPI003D8FD798